MFSYEICEIFKNIYFEEHLRRTASIYFTSKYYSRYTGGKFGLDEISTECNLSIFLNVTILFIQIQPYNLYVMKKSFFTFFFN